MTPRVTNSRTVRAFSLYLNDESQRTARIGSIEHYVVC